jgi:hypothetical protein
LNESTGAEVKSIIRIFFHFLLETGNLTDTASCVRIEVVEIGLPTAAAELFNPTAAARSVNKCCEMHENIRVKLGAH